MEYALQMAEATNLKLPTCTIPERYDIDIEIDFEQQVFRGTVLITANIVEATNYLVLHMSDLIIQYIKLRNENSFPPIEKSTDVFGTEKIAIIFGRSIPPSSIGIEIAYTGTLKDARNGLYFYTQKAGQGQRRFFSTKFEPIYAREFIPCFDEPKYRAVFKMNVTIASNLGYIALSNMPSVTVTKDAKTTFQFDATPPMSTYQLSLHIGDFRLRRHEFVGRRPFILTMYVTEDNLPHTDWAFSTAINAFEYFREYFPTIFPLPKIDILLVPNYPTRATEGYGLIAIEENSALFIENSGSEKHKQNIALLLAHEIAHVWLGGIVTMTWWNDLWLKEGLATFLEYKCVDNLIPHWKLDEQFLVLNTQKSLRIDSTINTHPINNNVLTNHEILEQYDMVNYGKGAALCRMIEDYVTPEEFRRALSQYMVLNWDKSARTTELFVCVDAVSDGERISDYLTTWVMNSGYPYIQVTKNPNGEFVLTQFPFYSSLYHEKDFLPDCIWSIPITYYTNKNRTVQRVWMTEREMTINVDPDVKWIKLNNNQAGFYRVYYPHNIWMQLMSELITNPTAFSIFERSQMIDEVFAFSEIGRLKYNHIFQLLSEYLSKETEYVPWRTGINNMRYLSRLSEVPPFRDFVKGVLSEAYARLGWDKGDDHLENLLRVNIISLCNEVELPDCKTETSNRFQLFMSNQQPSDVVSDYRGIVYYYGLQCTQIDSHIKTFLRILQLTRDPLQRKYMLEGIAGYPDIVNTFSYVIEHTDSWWDFLTYLKSATRDQRGAFELYPHIVNGRSRLVKYFPYDESVLKVIFEVVTRFFSTLSARDQVMEDLNDIFPEDEYFSYKLNIDEIIAKRAYWIRRLHGHMRSMVHTFNTVDD